MQTLCFEGLMLALSSIAHNGGQSFGTVTKLRREKFVQPDGTIEEVPVLSGNGLRGMLRDRGMLHMCRALGYGVDDATGDVRGLSLPAFYFLFSGGTLTTEAGRGLDLAYARKLRELIPLIAVFGGAISNIILPGKVKIGKAIPLCLETRHLVPERFQTQSQSAQSIWDYLQEEMYTRKDDAKNEHYRPLLAAGVRGFLDQGAASKRQRQDAGTDVAERPGTAQQMMYYVETFAPGTCFHWKIVADDLTDIEREAFLTCLAEFSRMPYVGGKSAVGLGEVAVNFDRWIEIDSRIQATGTEVSLPIGTLYHQHLHERGDSIREVLHAMA